MEVYEALTAGACRHAPRTAYAGGPHFSHETGRLMAAVDQGVPSKLDGYNWRAVVKTDGVRAEDKDDMSQAFGRGCGVREIPDRYSIGRAWDAHIATTGSSTSMREQMGLAQACDRLRLYSNRIRTGISSSALNATHEAVRSATPAQE